MTTAISSSNFVFSTTSSDAVSTSTYLSRLNAYIDPSRIETQESQAQCWKVAGIITTIALSIIATVLIGGFIFSMISFSVPLLFVGLGALSGALLTYHFFTRFATNMEKEVLEMKAIAHEAEKLQAITTPELQNLIMTQNALAWSQIPGMATHPDHLHTIKPLLAHQKYLLDRARSLEDAKQTKIVDALRLEGGNAPGIRLASDTVYNSFDVYTLRKQALKLESKALSAKLEAAFINAVLINPDTKANLKDLGATFDNHYLLCRLAASELHAPNANQFFGFNDRSLVPITIQEMRGSSIDQLGRRLLTAMTT